MPKSLTKCQFPQTRKLPGNNALHRLRIISEIHSDRLLILVVKIGHRKDVYARLP